MSNCMQVSTDFVLISLVDVRGDRSGVRRQRIDQVDPHQCVLGNLTISPRLLDRSDDYQTLSGASYGFFRPESTTF